MNNSDTQTQIENLRDQIEGLEDDIENLRSEKHDLEVEVGDLNIDIDQFDRSEYVHEEDFETWLDELHGEVTLGGSIFTPSEIIKELRPTDYRVGFNDYVDTLRDEDFQVYRDMVEKQEELNESIDDLNDQIENLVSLVDGIQNQIDMLEDE